MSILDEIYTKWTFKKCIKYLDTAPTPTTLPAKLIYSAVVQRLKELLD